MQEESVKNVQMLCRRDTKGQIFKGFGNEDDRTLTAVYSKKYCNISHMYYNADPYILEEVEEELMELLGPPTTDLLFKDASHSSGQETEKCESMSVNIKDSYYSDMNEGLKSRESMNERSDVLQPFID